MWQMHKMTKMTHAVAYPMVFFFFRFWSKFARTSTKIHEKRSFLGIFSRFGCLSPVFEQIRVWFISELHEMMKVSHAVAFPIIFFYFLIRFGMEDCWNLWKMILLKCFFSVVVRFIKILGSKSRCKSYFVLQK